MLIDQIDETNLSTLRTAKNADGAPVLEEIHWFLATGTQWEARGRELEGVEGLWAWNGANNRLFDIQDILDDNRIEPSEADKLRGEEPAVVIPDDSDYWSPFELPLREGLELIEEAEYTKLLEAEED